MKKNIKYIFLVLISLTPLFLAIVEKNGSSDFSCDADFKGASTDESFSVLMHFVFNNGNGRYNSTGRFIGRDQSVTELNRSFSFNYEIKNKNFVLSSQENDNNPNDFVGQSLLIPDFVRIRGRGIVIKIEPINKAGYLFTIGNTPAFYCKRSSV